MAKTHRKRPVGNRYVWRDNRSGRIVDVIVADPVVKPKGVTVGKIRKAVREVTGGRTSRPSRKNG